MMTTVGQSGPPPTTVQPAPGLSVSRLVIRQIRGGAVLAALFCGAMTWIFASQYPKISSLIEESGLQAMAGNPIERVALGPPLALDDPGGFTVWRTGTAVLVLASGWIALATTRISRGEEDAGRWDLLLAGRLRIADVLLRSLVAVAGSAALIGVAVASALLAAGTAVAGTVIHAVGIACVALTFATAALLASQVMPGRSSATGTAVAAIGVGLALRIAADSSPHLAWLAWATPFGLTARSAPYAENRVVPLIVLGVFPIVLAAAAVVAAHHRDLGDGVVTLSDSRPARTAQLQSVVGFALRRSARITLGWATGVVASFMLAGALLTTVLEYFRTNARIAEMAAAAGLSGPVSVNTFVAPLFSLLPAVTGLYAAIRLATLITDEKAGRWTLLFAQPLSRVRLLLAEVAVTVGAVIALHSSAAIAIWCGANLTGAPLRFADALAGALNPVPVALLAAGAAVLGVGWLPSGVLAIGALPIVGGYLVNVLTQSMNAPSWIAELSPWAHLAAVPDAPPNWGATIVLLLFGAILTALGVFGYVQRDVGP